MNKITRILPFLAPVLSGCAGLQPGCVSDAQEASLSTEEQRIDASFIYFHKSLNTRLYGYEIVAAPHPVRYGEKADRFEVRPGIAVRATGIATVRRTENVLNYPKPSPLFLRS